MAKHSDSIKGLAIILAGIFLYIHLGMAIYGYQPASVEMVLWPVRVIADTLALVLLLAKWTVAGTFSAFIAYSGFLATQAIYGGRIGK